MTDASVPFPGKRKRGRPRKDGNLYSSSQPSPNLNDGMIGKTVYGVIEGSFDDGYFISVKIANNGSPFRGVVFKSDKLVPITAANDIAPNAKMYQRTEIPIPLYNGIALQQPNQQPVNSPYVFNSHSTFTVPEATLPRVGSCSDVGGKITEQRTPKVGVNEQDEVMQLFEFSSLSKGSKNNIETTNALIPNSNFTRDTPQSVCETQHREFVHDGWQEVAQMHSVSREPQAFNSELEKTDMYHKIPDHNSNQNLFTYQSQDPNRDGFVDSISKSPNLELDLASSIMQEKRPNIGYHQALVTGNPLLLPPELSNEPVKFMPKSPSKNDIPRDTNSGGVETNERFGDTSRTAETSSPSATQDREEAPVKLELAPAESTRLNKETNSSTGCITDMDFVLSDVVPATESHDHQNWN
ncbi:hypothetical protein ACJIZ3_012744 [Penstemon smallii]|uniref:Uncharacterized protein n=1 Tax=Penstemon smallii TaxID=265156 RepID=A0ABD3UMY6_9LAMI